MTLTLSTGREIYTNYGIIGLAPDFSVYHGYDGQIFDFDWVDNGLYEPLTKAELKEIANLMIERWTRFIEKLEAADAP